MKKRVVSLLALVVLALSLSVHAAEPRAISAYPDLYFNGTEANCSVAIYAGSSDKISATIKLWRGSTCLKTWTASGTGTLSFYETATVSKGKTYKLEISYSVAGVSQPNASSSATC